MVYNLYKNESPRDAISQTLAKLRIIITFHFCCKNKIYVDKYHESFARVDTMSCETFWKTSGRLSPNEIKDTVESDLPPPHRFKKFETHPQLDSDEYKRILQYKIAIHRDILVHENLQTTHTLRKSRTPALNIDEWRSLFARLASTEQESIRD